MIEAHQQRQQSIEKSESIMTRIIISISASYLSLIGSVIFLILSNSSEESNINKQFSIFFANTAFYILYICYCINQYFKMSKSQKDIIDIKPIQVFVINQKQDCYIETNNLRQFQTSFNKISLYFYLIGAAILIVFLLNVMRFNLQEVQCQFSMFFSFFGHLVLSIRILTRVILKIFKYVLSCFQPIKLLRIIFSKINIFQQKDKLLIISTQQQQQQNQNQQQTKQRTPYVLKMSQLVNDDCSICLDKLQDGQQAAIFTECKHYFHQECIQSWIQHNETCPVCRAQIYQSF